MKRNKKRGEDRSEEGEKVRRGEIKEEKNRGEKERKEEKRRERE